MDYLGCRNISKIKSCTDSSVSSVSSRSSSRHNGFSSYGNILNGQIFSVSVSFCLCEKISNNYCNLDMGTRPKLKQIGRKFSLFVSKNNSNGFNGGGGGDYYSCRMNVKTIQIGNLLLKQINVNADKLLKTDKEIRRDREREIREKSIQGNDSFYEAHSKNGGDRVPKRGRNEEYLSPRGKQSLHNNTSTEKFCNKISQRKNPYKSLSRSSSETSDEGKGRQKGRRRSGLRKKPKPKMSDKRRKILKAKMRSLGVVAGLYHKVHEEHTHGVRTLDGNQQMRVAASGQYQKSQGVGGQGVRPSARATHQSKSGRATSSRTTARVQYKVQQSGQNASTGASAGASVAASAKVGTNASAAGTTATANASAGATDNANEDDNADGTFRTEYKTLPDGTVVRVRYRLAQPGEDFSNLPTQTLPDGTVVRMNYGPGADPNAGEERQTGGGRPLSPSAEQAKAARARRLAKLERNANNKN